MSKIVGIDLGTTNSAIGIMVDGAPQLIPNAIGKYLTQSVVGIDQSGEVLVGGAAKDSMRFRIQASYGDRLDL